LTTNFGYQIRSGSAISFELDGKDSIWAVSGTAGVSVNILSVSLEGTRIV
jgi:sugar lactone lactonase YvrE